MDTRKLNPKLILVLFLIVLLGPFGFAMNIHKKGKHATLNHTNIGDLITPVKKAQDLTLTSLEDQHTFQGDKLKGKWQFLYVPPLHCDENCHDTLDMMGQIHHSLHKLAPDLERMLVLLEGHTLAEYEKYDKKYVLNTQSYNQTLGSIGNKAKRDELGEFYLIDPNGYIMMYYAGDTPPKGILKDLKKLLKNTPPRSMA